VIVSRRSEALSPPDLKANPQGLIHVSPPADALPMPEVHGFEHRYVAVNGARLHYAGSGRGDPVVLLHSWPQHWWAWRELSPRLSAGYRVICPDIRGFGWSEGGSDYDLEQLAADTVGLLDALGIERARLVGHGWGAEIGYRACLNWPGRFSHFVPIGGFTPWSSGVPAKRLYLRSWHIYALGLLGSSATTRLGVPENALRSWRHDGRFTPAEVQTYLGPLRRPVCVDATSRLYRHVLLHELPHFVRSSRSAPLQVPTLHVHGEQDPLAGGAVHSPRRGAADTRFELIPGCGHFVAEERPTELLDCMTGFLT
jgi:pimeloyl-ACP methyl ester carboxylesterase